MPVSFMFFLVFANFMTKAYGDEWADHNSGYLACREAHLQSFDREKFNQIAKPIERAIPYLPSTGYRLPNLLTPSTGMPTSVCQKALQENKRLALVKLGTHFCGDSGACIRTTRDLADPCNQFIQKNFSVHEGLWNDDPENSKDWNNLALAWFGTEKGKSVANIFGPQYLVLDCLDPERPEFLNGKKIDGTVIDPHQGLDVKKSSRSERAKIQRDLILNSNNRVREIIAAGPHASTINAEEAFTCVRGQSIQFRDCELGELHNRFLSKVRELNIPAPYLENSIEACGQLAAAL